MSPRHGVMLIWSAKLGAAATKDAAMATAKRVDLKNCILTSSAN